MKTKKLYLFFTLTIAVGTLLIFVNDLKKPKSVQAQCVQIGSTDCRWIEKGEVIVNSDHLWELKCHADEYVGSVIYRTGGKMDDDDVQIKCCKFLVSASN